MSEQRLDNASSQVPAPPQAGGPLVAVANNATLLLCITTLIWGGNAIAGKFAVGHVSPMLLTLFRWGIAVAVLLVFAWPHLKRDWGQIRAHWLYLLCMGATGFAIFNGFLYTALKYTSAINVTILQAGMPLFVFVFSFVAFRIPTRFWQAAGYLLTLLGVLWLASQGDLMRLVELNLNRGDAIMLGAVLTYAGYSAFLRAKPEMHWLSFICMLSLAALVTSIPMALYEWQSTEWIFPVTAQGWLVVIYAGLFPSLVAQTLFIRGVQLLGGNTAGLFINLVPIWGALLAVLLLDEMFETYHAVALVLVIVGVLAAQVLGSRVSNKAAAD